MKLFDSIRVTKPRRNKFDLSHEVKMTGNMGELYPILCEEVVPGDKFRVSSEVFLRFLALIAPVMHRVDVTVHFFFVPNRLIWKSWEDFITGGRDGLAAPPFPTFKPQDVNTTGALHLKNGSLLDYLGYPMMKQAGGYSANYNTVFHSALPLRAYQLIYDTYYRDQNVTASIISSTFDADGNVGVGADLSNLLTLRKRAWPKDYYTSALPWTQRGAEVSLPIDTTITAKTTGDGGTHPYLRRSSDGAKMIPNALANIQHQNVTGDISGTDAAAANTDAYYDPAGTLIGTSSSLTVNALRVSISLQEWLEKKALGGGRYREQLMALFGVMSSDARLSRVEYLGGGKQPVVISEVLTTAPAAAGPVTPPGTMAGHGVSVGTSNQFSKYFEEHGFVVGVISIVPLAAYQQTTPKVWQRDSPTKYFFPDFAHLGEQAILNGDIYTDWGDAGAAAARLNTWGYQSRYSEYKYIQSRVAGYFRENMAYWHLGRIFSAQPNLNTAFVESDPRTDIFAVTTDVHHLVMQIYHRIDAMRPMPYFGTPKL